MEVKIGVQNAPRELVVDVDDTADEVQQRIADALTTDGGMLALTDTKGRRVLVPAGKVAYVEIGSVVVGTVGFRS
ncbi:DUF3107 domain-containing protein [Nocardioides sp.]|uniref:DUF3107 domain-containing protein n=1 Tax=Nocardioides sp. TaxID=35761 RepID=UPI0035116D41